MIQRWSLFLLPCLFNALQTKSLTESLRSANKVENNRRAKMRHKFLNQNQSPSLFFRSREDSFIKTSNQQDQHTLRICNAYPSTEEVDIYRGSQQLIPTDGEVRPLGFKNCRDYRLVLKPGDQFDFRLHSVSSKAQKATRSAEAQDLLGSFAISDQLSALSENSLLFLSFYKHDTLSTAVSFASHVFANLSSNAQVAVLDLFKANDDPSSKKSREVVEIEDHDGSDKRTEDLAFDSVAAVNPGKYWTVLKDTESGKVQAKKELIAKDRESYVLLRVGADGKDGAKSYSQDLLVFPQMDVVGQHWWSSWFW